MNVYKLHRAEKICFVLGLIVLLYAGSGIAAHTARKAIGTNALKRNSIFAELAAEMPNSIDLAVMGDSESYTSVLPMKLWKDMGIPSYLAGQASQSMSELYSTLEALTENQKLKVILLETNLFFRNRKSLTGIEEMIAVRAASMLPIFQYHDLWKCAFVKPKQTTGKWKGYKLKESVVPYSKDYDYMKETDKKKAISWFNLALFDQFLQKCRDSGIRVILYSAPSPVNYGMRRHNALVELAKEKQLVYIDLNQKIQEMGIDWEKDTMDGGDHLNVSGAEKATAYLEKVLETLDLKDQRKDPAYDEWNKGADEFAKMADKYISSIRSK